jgi:hypothetical protein
MKKNHIAIFSLIVITSVILFFIFKPVLQHPNGYIFSKSGDAIKGYYNFSYSLKYNSGTKLDGVNYPYGEHSQYDNTQPSQLGIFRVINNIVPISTSGIGILNLSMILSILLAIPFIFLILRRSKLPIWYSSVVTIIILFLSPQLQRFQAQIEMSYLFFIPMLWYFLIKFRDGKNQWVWATFITLLGILGGFTSSYYLGFYSFFIFAIILSDCWIGRKELKKHLKPGIGLFALAIVPILIATGFALLTDWVSDRPENPFGFFVYKSNLFSIFMPFDQLVKLLPENIYNMTGIKWEGQAFVGLPAMVVAVVFSIMFLYRFYTRRNIATIFPLKELNTFLLAAFLILLFSMCIPGTGILAVIIPPLKQFRALGRFSWIFFYVFTIYAAIYIYQYFIKLREDGKMKKSVWFIVLTLAFWSYDAYANADASFRNIISINDKLEKSDTEYLTKTKINPTDFQAIFALPFANTTGDKLMLERGMNAFAEAMKCSYHTHLPIIESLSPYISFENALSSVQILADSCIRKTRFDDMNSKPILLVCANENLSKEEAWLKDRSEIIWSDKYVSLAKISPEFFSKSYQSWISWADSIQNTLQGNEKMKADVDLKKVFFLDFDQQKSKNIFTGNGALYKRNKTVDVFTENLPEKGMTGNYNLSFWLYFDTRVFDMPKATINIIDKYDFITDKIILSTRQEHNIYKNWIRIDQPVTFNPGFKYQLELEGKYITIDNLLIQPEGSNVYVKSGNVETMNNFVIER